MGLAELMTHDHSTSILQSAPALTDKLLNRGPGTDNMGMHGSGCFFGESMAHSTHARAARAAHASTARLAHPTCPHPPTLPAARQWHCASSVHTRAYNTRALSSDAAHGRRTASRTHTARAHAAGLIRTTRGTPWRCARRTPSAERRPLELCGFMRGFSVHRVTSKCI